MIKKEQASPSSAASRNPKQLTLIGLMTAVTCILGPLSLPLPFSPVPISLTNFSIFCMVYILGTKRSIISYLIYLLIGLAGIPVFSSFTGGPGKLLGPTGGYLIGFIFMTLICGGFIEKWPSSIVLCFIGMILGTAVCNLFGTLWLSKQGGITFLQALAAGVLPFIPGDLIKIFIAMLIGPQIRKRLHLAGLL